MHRRAVAALLAARRRDVSLVDYTSFELMRQTGIYTVFTFNRHFASRALRSCPPDTHLTTSHPAVT